MFEEIAWVTSYTAAKTGPNISVTVSVIILFGLVGHLFPPQLTLFAKKRLPINHN